MFDSLAPVSRQDFVRPQNSGLSPSDAPPAKSGSCSGTPPISPTPRRAEIRFGGIWPRQRPVVPCPAGRSSSGARSAVRPRPVTATTVGRSSGRPIGATQCGAEPEQQRPPGPARLAGSPPPAGQRHTAAYRAPPAPPAAARTPLVRVMPSRTMASRGLAQVERQTGRPDARYLDRRPCDTQRADGKAVGGAADDVPSRAHVGSAGSG